MLDRQIKLERKATAAAATTIFIHYYENLVTTKKKIEREEKHGKNPQQQQLNEIVVGKKVNTHTFNYYGNFSVPTERVHY